MWVYRADRRSAREKWTEARAGGRPAIARCWSSSTCRTISAPAARSRCRTGDAIVPAVNRLAGAVRACRPDPGLASAGAFVLCRRASRPAALRDGRGGLRRADPVAGSLRAGDAGRGVPPGLAVPHAELVLRKGFRREIDSYSAFRENDRRPRPGLPPICASAASSASPCAGSRPIIACCFRRSTRARPGSRSRLRADACRGIDLDGSLARAMRAMAEAGVSIRRLDAARQGAALDLKGRLPPRRHAAASNRRLSRPDRSGAGAGRGGAGGALRDRADAGFFALVGRSLIRTSRLWPPIAVPFIASTASLAARSVAMSTKP